MSAKPTTATSPTSRSQTASRQRTAWLILAVLLLFSVAAPLNQFKVPPIMPLLMEDLRLSAAWAGLLMSVYAVTGLVLALPSGFIFQKAGFRITGVLAGGSIILGAALGATSGSVDGVLSGRVIEGVGTSFMAVLAPAIIAQWFTAQKRGTAMGIWAAWVPIGSSAMLILAPVLAQWGSWRAVWWFGCVYAALVTVLYLAFVKPAPGRSTVVAVSGAEGRGQRGPEGSASSEVLRNSNIWLLGAAFACFNMAVIGFGTYFPTFLNSMHGLSLVQASLVASIPVLITIFSAPAGGILSDRVGSRKRPYLVGFVLTSLTLPLASILGAGALIVIVVFQGLVMGLIPTNVFSAAIEATGDERQGGLAMAIIMVGQNAGMLAGPVIVGTLIESAGGWPLAFTSLGIMCLLGALAGWLARVK